LHEATRRIPDRSAIERQKKRRSRAISDARMFRSLPQDSPALESKFRSAGATQNHRVRSSDSVVAAPQPVRSAYGKFSTQIPYVRSTSEYPSRRKERKGNENQEIESTRPPCHDVSDTSDV
jgi:hypothetical protein